MYTVADFLCMISNYRAIFGLNVFLSEFVSRNARPFKNVKKNRNVNIDFQATGDVKHTTMLN